MQGALGPLLNYSRSAVGITGFGPAEVCMAAKRRKEQRPEQHGRIADFQAQIVIRHPHVHSREAQVHAPWLGRA